MTETGYKALLQTSYNLMSRDQRRAAAILSRHGLWPVTSRGMSARAKMILNVRPMSSRLRPMKPPRGGYNPDTLSFVEEMISLWFGGRRRWAGF